MNKKTIFFAIVSLFALTATAQTTYFVKTDGNTAANGLTWENAIPLDNALAKAVSGDVINIAAGTYMPTVLINSTTSPLTDADKTFHIRQNISLIGGYPEDATTGATADPKTNETVLSGNNTCYHVIVVSAPVATGEKVILNGLKITGGNANGSGNVATANGGTVNVARNSAGGMSIAKSTVEFSDCSISGNKANSGANGIYALSAATVTFNRCSIADNTGAGNGGGVWLATSTLYMYDSTISNNTAGTAGGLYPYNGSKFYVFNSTIDSNTTTAQVAGVYARENVEGYLVNTTIANNVSTHASAGVGGISTYTTAGNPVDISIVNTTITGNTGTSSTITIMNSNITTVKLYNSIVSGNTTPTEVLTSANGIYTQQNNIIGTKIYDATGAEVSDVTFNPATQLGTLADNGGYTKTCLLLGENNPATTYGMNNAALTTLAGTFTPAIPTAIITKDQAGSARSGHHIGALAKDNLTTSAQQIFGKSGFAFTAGNALYVKANSDIRVYAANGQLVRSLPASEDLTEIGGLQRGIYIVTAGGKTQKVIL